MREITNPNFPLSFVVLLYFFIMKVTIVIEEVLSKDYVVDVEGVEDPAIAKEIASSRVNTLYDKGGHRTRLFGLPLPSNLSCGLCRHNSRDTNHHQTAHHRRIHPETTFQCGQRNGETPVHKGGAAQVRPTPHRCLERGDQRICDCGVFR